MKQLILFTFIFFSLSNHCFGQLKLEDIMKGKDFIGHWPEAHSWAPNGEILFKWNPDNINVSEYYYSINNEPVKLPDNKLTYLPNRGMVKHPTEDFYVYAKDGRILKWKTSEASPKVLYESYDRIHTVHLVKDPNKIFFTRNKSLCFIDTKSSQFKELVKFEKKENEVAKSKQENFLFEQQKELFDYYNISENTKKRTKIVRDKQTAWKRKAVGIENGDFEGVFISPNESTLIYLVSDFPKQKYTHVENYVSENGWSSSIKARPKVGRPDNKHILYVYNLEADSSVMVAIDILTGVFDRPSFIRDYVNVDFLNQLDAPKNVIYHDPIFNKDGDKAIIEIKSYDNKDRWITILDLSTGELKEIDHQHDEAWVGGPGISGWNSVMGSIGWIDNDNSIWYQSEQTGYSHLYMCSIKNLKKTALTKGDYEVRKPQLSKNGELFYLTLNKTHPGNRNFYHLNWKKNVLIPILENEGNYDVEVSPDEQKIAYLYSTKNQPWELFIGNNSSNSQHVKITNSKTKEFSSYNWKKPEIISFKAMDGLSVPARIYKPAVEKRNGAAVIFVHGAGYLQNAHNWWSGYYREYMFHHLLNEKGYLVLDIDYRASEGYGRDWRTAIYRHMGGWDLKDQLSGRDYLINKLNIDSSRIGIYGGSYGGFITLMALLTEPGKFACGAALRSVTDWAHYNHEYTSNILNTPEEDSIAFVKSSPIYFAEGLSDPLLMLHGVKDDNVQFQDVIRLSQRFIELEKDNWELAVYPVEPHGFKESSSWLDEYKRILKLFERHLK